MPGLHVNTLAALAVTVVPLHAPAVLCLVAAGTVHTFVGILPATYLGVPDEDAPVAALPAHRLLHEGQGPAAVRLSLDASLAAAVLAVLLLPAYAALLRWPPALPLLDAATPWLLLAVVAVMLWSERRRGHSAILWAAAILVAAGVLGHATLSLPTPGASSPLLPLLAGLFGSPSLLATLRWGTRVPIQAPARSRPVPLGTVLPGILAAAWTAVLPGVTAATATAVARAGRLDDPRAALATLSAVDTAHATLSLGVLWVLLRPRTGLARFVTDGPTLAAWTGTWPPAWTLWLAATVLAAALAAVAAGRLLEPLVRGLATRARPTFLAAVVLVGLTTLVLVLTGTTGLLVYGVATALGLVPLAVGVRRIHLTGCLLLPVLWP